MAAAVAAAGQSVVTVSGRRRLAATGLVWSADGLIVSANHVVSQRRASRVTLPSGETVEATVVGRDAGTDLAVLKIEREGLIKFDHVPADDLKVGQFALALGRASGSIEATLGIISGLGGRWQTAAGGAIDRYIQTDVVMYPGFSGGPLIDAGGRLVGLNSSHLARGVSVTVPAATVATLANSLVSDGHIKRGYLGVKTQGVRLPEQQAETLNQKTGLLIVGVESGSPAETSGLLLGDIIVKFGGHSIRHGDDLIAQLGGAADQKSPATLIRAGRVEEVTIQVGSR